MNKSKNLQALRSKEADVFVASLPPVISENIWGEQTKERDEPMNAKRLNYETSKWENVNFKVLASEASRIAVELKMLDWNEEYSTDVEIAEKLSELENKLADLKVGMQNIHSAYSHETD